MGFISHHLKRLVRWMTASFVIIVKSINHVQKTLKCLTSDWCGEIRMMIRMCRKRRLKGLLNETVFHQEDTRISFYRELTDCVTFVRASTPRHLLRKMKIYPLTGWAGSRETPWINEPLIMTPRINVAWLWRENTVCSLFQFPPFS